MFITPLNSVIDTPDNMITQLRGMVLWAYTAATCDDETVKSTNESYHAFIDDDNAHIEFLSLGNRLQKNGDPTSSRPLDMEKYESKEISLNGFIRHLPAGAKASEKAIELAQRAGLELAVGETYVQPFIRRSWVLRETEEDKLNDSQ